MPSLLHHLGWAVLAAASTAAATLALARWGVARLPEPPEPDGKPPYAALATWRFALLTALTSAVAGLVSLPLLTPWLWPVWCVLNSLALCLAAIDLCTTWLPLALTKVTWLALGSALVVLSWGLGPLRTAVALGGAALAAAIYGLVWRTTGGIAFGDVRFAGIVGAAAGAVSLDTLVATLLLGSVLGVVWGLLGNLRGRHAFYPLAPSMLAGSYLGLMWASATG